MVHVFEWVLTLLGGGGCFKWCMFLIGFLTFLGGGFKWCMFLSGFFDIFGMWFQMVHVFEWVLTLLGWF